MVNNGARLPKALVAMNRIRLLFSALFVLPLLVVVAPTRSAAVPTESDQVGSTPAMGWSSWSYLRQDPTASAIEAQAAALKSSGLAGAGYIYVNVDDFWYACPGSQGPSVDALGRWIPDPKKFPSVGSTNGIQAVANYVHSLGLKFGIYVTPGISKQAVQENTPIAGTSYSASDIATQSSAGNYDCGGMLAINYAQPGAQAFVNSWADELAQWGVDYVKLDGVGSGDIGDIEAWSAALQQSGRPIHLELANSLDVSKAAIWRQYSNGWRTGGDIECYGCDSAISSFPLTDWTNVESRFDEVATWQPFGGPGGFNDYDSLELGNGDNDGLTPDERQSEMSLWALASSPLLIGADVTHLDPTDLTLLKDADVIEVDQDSIDASRIIDSGGEQVFTKMESNGDLIVGIFNTGSGPLVAALGASQLGLPNASGYVLDNLWTHRSTESGTTISGDVAPHGVVLYRITPLTSSLNLPPSTALLVSPLNGEAAGAKLVATECLYNFGLKPIYGIHLALKLPPGWSATPSTTSSFKTLAAGHALEVDFRVTVGDATASFRPEIAQATVQDWWRPETPKPGADPPSTVGGEKFFLGQSIDEPVETLAPIEAPLETYSSAVDAPAVYRESGSQIGIQGAGTDVYSTNDTYSAVFQHGTVGTQSTVTTEVVSQDDMTGYAKAGIMIRNDIADSGSSPEGVILFESPAGGIQMEWDNNDGGFVNSDTPGNGTIMKSLPVWLKLVRNGTLYSGYYSTDGSTWTSVGSANVRGQATVQDAGDFMVRHAQGSVGDVTFENFSVK